MKNNDDQKAFVTVTNRDIYNTIQNNHNELVKRLEAVERQTTLTNGKVKMNTLQLKGVWATFGAVLAFLVWLIQQHAGG